MTNKTRALRSNWIKASEQLPPENVSVLVFIPEEDNHCTTGMWDVSKKWVLLDEYRVPKSEVTYWAEMGNLPEDRSYTPSDHRPEAEDTLSYQMRAIQKQIFELEKWKREMMEAWGPVLDYAQKNGDKLKLKLGESISKRVLDILKYQYE